jgi:hypothetical protein
VLLAAQDCVNRENYNLVTAHLRQALLLIAYGAKDCVNRENYNPVTAHLRQALLLSAHRQKIG